MSPSGIAELPYDQCEHGPPMEGGIYALVFYKHGPPTETVARCEDRKQDSAQLPE
jgi:hypothetical protein